MTHIKKYLLWYILGALALIYVIISLVKKEWNPLKWFEQTPSTNIGGPTTGTGRFAASTGRDTNLTSTRHLKLKRLVYAASGQGPVDYSIYECWKGVYGPYGSGSFGAFMDCLVL